jgi:diguanylate cyclase (GGDEF)-like protein
MEPANRFRQGGSLAMLKVNASDPDLRRRGRILSVVILGVGASTAILAVVNVLQGQHQYDVSNGIFLALMLGLFALNRLGYVAVASTMITALLVAGSLLFFSEKNLAQTFIIACIPVFIASFLIVPWSGIAVCVVVISGTLMLGYSSINYLSLFVLAAVTMVVYLLTRSLDVAHQENRHRAFHDILTGLPNRALFLDRLQQSLDRSDRDRIPRAVLFMDLDNFKVINDSLGHKVGDELLMVVARRLMACLRPGDTAARLGGDEFVVLLDGVAGVGEADLVAERIIGALGAPIELGGRRVFVGTSVGIALCEDTACRPDVLLRDADVAMYEAKKEGKARRKVFNPAMHAQALHRLELENELRRAIEHGELRLYYQPMVLLSTGKVIGMEALVRWEHPERGLIRPREFIPLAEETGLIVPLGRWVLRETCRRACEWGEQYPTASPLLASVNLSVVQFREPDLVGELQGILRETGLEPSRLQLEITESAVVDDTERATALLWELKGLGVRLAIDDFGTGYSSLASLRQFPVDDLKIDKKFVDGLGQNESDAAIVRLVIDLAHALGMQAIAEGVETPEQLARLRDMGCDQAQGYYFWESLPDEEAARLLAGSPLWLLNPHTIGRSRNIGAPPKGRSNPN